MHWLSTYTETLHIVYITTKEGVKQLLVWPQSSVPNTWAENELLIGHDYHGLMAEHFPHIYIYIYKLLLHGIWICVVIIMFTLTQDVHKIYIIHVQCTWLFTGSINLEALLLLNQILLVLGVHSLYTLWLSLYSLTWSTYEVCMHIPN